MTFKHSYMVITTNFELEPVLDQFFETYPQNAYERYQVVYKTLDEHAPGEISYIIVFELSRLKGRVPRFSEFLKAYCMLNAKTAVAQVTNSVLPRLDSTLGRGHVFGELKPNAKT